MLVANLLPFGSQSHILAFVSSLKEVWCNPDRVLDQAAAVWASYKQTGKSKYALFFEVIIYSKLQAMLVFFAPSSACNVMKAYLYRTWICLTKAVAVLHKTNRSTS